MAQVEPMDIDDLERDFDNKENSSQHSNVLPRTPCADKGYEELDMSELNMKLRYSITPASSPMSRSLNDYEINTNNAENTNFTRSLNYTMTNSEIVNPLKSHPLQAVTSDKMNDDKSQKVLQTIQPGPDNHNMTVTLCGAGDNVDNVSLPSTSSSMTHTPEATTPTKEIPKHDGSSPIMRGLKSVLNMFRSSQSPIPPSDSTITSLKQENLSPNDSIFKGMESSSGQTVVVSTPISDNRKLVSQSRRSSPLKESIVFNDDLEKDLQWKDETTIFFKDEKIPIHKLFPSQSSGTSRTAKCLKMDKNESKSMTEEYMSMSNNASIYHSGNAVNTQHVCLQNEGSAMESDGEFVDCEMTLNGEFYCSKLPEKEDAYEIKNNNEFIQENTKQVIDNIEEFLRDCYENKSLVHKSYDVSSDVSTAVCPDQNIALNCNINYQRDVDANIERTQNMNIDEQNAVEHVTPANKNLCENNVKKCDLINDYNEKNHPSEVPLPDDSNLDFMEFPSTIKDINELKVSTVQQDLDQTAMSIDYNESVMTDEFLCKHGQNRYNMKVDQVSNQENTGRTQDLSTTDKSGVFVSNETTLQQVGLHKQEGWLKENIDSIDTSVNAMFKPVATEINCKHSEINNTQNKLTTEDTLRSICGSDDETKTKKLTLEISSNEHLRITSEKDDLSLDPYQIPTEHAYLNNCGTLNTTTNQQNATAAENLRNVQDGQEHATNVKEVSNAGDETVIIESYSSDKYTYLNERNDSALDTTFNMEGNKIQFENVINMDKTKTHFESQMSQDTVISDLVESSKKDDVYKDTEIQTNLNAVADEGHGNSTGILDPEELNQGECLNKKEINSFYSNYVVLPEETKSVDVSVSLHPGKNEEVQLEHCLNVKTSLDYVQKTYHSIDIPSNLSDQDNLVESTEEFACQIEKSSDPTSATSNEIACQEQFAVNTASHDKVKDIITGKNMSPVKTSEPKNVFNLPEMSSSFISKLKENVATALPPNAIASTEHIFKIPSSNSTISSQKSDGTACDADRKLCVDKNELDSSDVSTSSKASETTVHEVNTEDDDTVEGSFFESEEFSDVDKKSDHEDMIDFSDIPTQRINSNPYKGEMFIDAEAFQFLLNQNKSNIVADSGRESLFLKFDPLFAKRMSTDAAAVDIIQKGQSTPKRISKALSNIDFYKNSNETTESTLEANFEDATVLLSKPMMVVNPAVNSVFSPRNKSCTPPRANRRSHTFTSPAIAVIDRLLSLSGDTSALNLEMSITDIRGRTHETDQALTQLRELLAEKEINVHGLRSESKELAERLRTLESQVKMIETESEQRFRKVDELNKCLVEKTKMNKGMAVVVEEYERTIASLTAEIEQDKKAHAEERRKLINERNEQNAHLASMAMSFNDLHSKYEKNKQIILSCKDNEEKYKRSMKEFDESVIKIQNNYELLKQHATSNLNNKNDEFDKLNRTHEAEVLKYGAMIKRKEMDISSLKETLAQKIKANEELTAICDELLNKVA